MKSWTMKALRQRLKDSKEGTPDWLGEKRTPIPDKRYLPRLSKKRTPAGH